MLNKHWKASSGPTDERGTTYSLPATTPPPAFSDILLVSALLLNGQGRADQTSNAQWLRPRLLTRTEGAAGAGLACRHQLGPPDRPSLGFQSTPGQKL